MVLEHASADPRVALFLAEQLQILRSGADPSAIGNNIARDRNTVTTQGDIPGTEIFPRGWWVREADRTYLFILGCQQLSHATHYISYMGSPWTSLQTGVTGTGYLVSARDHYLAPITAVDQNQAGNLLVAGHSLGGALAQDVADAARIRRIRTGHSVVTFGSPKIAESNVQFQVLQHQNVIRWMVDSDPVPDIPPAVVTNLASVAALGVGQLQEFATARHTPGGVSINSLGITQDVPTPPMSVLNFGASLINWLWNISQQRETVHDLPEYIRRLQLVVALTTPPLHAEVIASGPEPAANASRRNANRQMQDSVDRIIRVAATQNASQLGVPPDRAFNTYKIGPFWWVEFNGQIVAVGPRRKQAGLMARLGNQFLRRLQRMGGVDVNGLTEMLRLYLIAAAAPDSGFTPAIARLD